MTRFFIFDKTWFLQNSIMKCIGIRPYEKCINEDGGVILKPIGGFQFWFRFIISIIVWIIFESLFFWYVMSYELDSNAMKRFHESKLDVLTSSGAV